MVPLPPGGVGCVDRVDAHACSPDPTRFMLRVLPTSRLPHRRILAALGATALAIVSVAASMAGAGEIDDLRGEIPSGEAVRAEIDELSALRDGLLAELNTAESDLTATLAKRQDLDAKQRRLTAQIEAATDHLRTVAVRAFVSGEAVGDLEFLVDVSDVSDLSWRHHLLRNHAGSSELALARLRELDTLASDEVRETIAAAGAGREEIARLEFELASIEPMIDSARAIEPLADAWDRASIAIAEGSYGVAPSEKWERMRFCESTDDYTATSASGRYRGAYQFDHETWRTVGGTGDPAAAPAEEQDARARELYARRGRAPWPQCGHHLS